LDILEQTAKAKRGITKLFATTVAVLLTKRQKEKRRMMKMLMTTTAFLAIASASASAEIMCTERGGCWETGRQIRLLPNDRGVGTTIPSRDGKGTVSTQNMPIANDVPHQFFPQRSKVR
jgi:hypothetical protein